MTGESAKGNKTKLNFTVTCGLLKLNLTALSSETDKTISKIEVTGKLEGASEATTYTLTCNAEDGESIESAKDFYIALPAGSYTDMLFYNKSGYVCPKSAKKASLSGWSVRFPSNILFHQPEETSKNKPYFQRLPPLSKRRVHHRKNKSDEDYTAA